MLSLDNLKKSKAKQLVVEVAEYGDRFVARFHVPEYVGVESSEYLAAVKKPTLANLRQTVAANLGERFEGYVIAADDVDGLDAGIALCRRLLLECGLSCFEPLATIDLQTDGVVQHLFWAGNARDRGEVAHPADVARADGLIDWDAERWRISEECKRVITAYLDDHPDEKVKSITLQAVEHVGLLVNGHGPQDCDYFPTNIYSQDIELFVQANGTEQYHACLKKVLGALRTDAELKGRLARGFTGEVLT